MTEYMPIPNRNATRLFVHTAGTRIIFMSMSGCRDRDSTTHPDHADDDGQRRSARGPRPSPSPTRGPRSRR